MVAQIAGERVRGEPGQTVVADGAQDAPPDGVLDLAPLPASGHLAEVREGQGHARLGVAEGDEWIAGPRIHRGRELEEIDIEPALVVMVGQGVMGQIVHGLLGHPLEAEVGRHGGFGQGRGLLLRGVFDDLQSGNLAAEAPRPVCFVIPGLRRQTRCRREDRREQGGHSAFPARFSHIAPPRANSGDS